jgi:hypothetical protein
MEFIDPSVCDLKSRILWATSGISLLLVAAVTLIFH